MIFSVNQRIICVDSSLPANPWHRAHPLIKNRIYVVYHLEGPECISIDGSKRAWQNWRFRPIVERETDISILRALLKERETTA